jgi:hypothetical protein
MLYEGVNLGPVLTDPTTPTASNRSQSAAPTRASQEKGVRMFWWLIDGVLDGDWKPFFCVLLLVSTLLAVGFLL